MGEIDTAQMPMWIQILGMVIGPILTYLGLRYKEAPRLKEIADQSVAKTLKGQDSKIDSQEDRIAELELSHRKMLDAYNGIRTSMVQVRAQADALRIHFVVYVRLVEQGLPEAHEQMIAVTSAFEEFFASVDGVVEKASPFERTPEDPPPRTEKVPLE